MKNSNIYYVIANLCLLRPSNAFQYGSISPSSKPNCSCSRHRHSTSRPSLISRGMKSSSSTDRFEQSIISPSASSPSQSTYISADGRSRKTSLSVATLGDGVDGRTTTTTTTWFDSLTDISMGSGNDHAVDVDAATKVLSASLLVTSNTVGPSMFTLPEAVGGVGMMWGTVIFFVLYMYNLISGLLLAEVAIKIHESSECEVPSSFKDFVDTALQSETAGTLTAGASLVSNSCFLAYGIVHAGSLIGNSFHGIGLDPMVGAGAFAAIIAYFSLTHTNTGLEKIANAAVMVVFSSFAALLLPSISDVSDPMGTLLAPGAYPDDFGAALAAAVPLLLSSLVYQNIVPSITKLLDFDRTKSTIAIAVGSFLPMAMYLAWCFAALGGGLECATSSGAGAAAFTAFSVAALVGSCITAVMSLAEEYESIISRKLDDDDPCPVTNRFSTPAVAAAMVPSVAVALAYSNGGDLTGALHFNGAFITPFLYGLLPIILYDSVGKLTRNTEGSPPFWKNLPLALLGAGTIGAVGQDIIQDIPSLRNLLA